ncbi:hypothetical protein A3H80_04160 [Candidatus Roizmanbacteria bacterium RIFCSPLOWO2_02_FULL_37_19]|uniref:BioF2-like acetyltransferase domain-containing protein n=1 Tax=Candidatus Roizmanbacteria bacterium RIFCSPHIGHO2_02_FULL_37_24 TaxID=1802037 RepID=A0A1F7GZH1_9BACT|nr:MAG: hypothetical protein A3C24_00285 [Candidatus Roizmanbacteria bacterium RIFCSPHIGHO2_02_FULL_37_24]OGK32595.1 MAG: hypothetical protein A3E10_02680 [Candidatus Roizmanbacteria bacterium RIFCSPHIGHO2_12_FULL_37_23]OGK43580.1 MAG: hypothetical protein A2956_00750 [Candidatus Roizmanbacteria bacterium RIFCSPLOWO2_01_FULL_37_57]OGK53726.1 MAG: hypothetical protein A3H80_04160 [Candidatus Roizmanbacteria bacterium RIFCSPLOWO2_02_FULL_37_19]
MKNLNIQEVNNKEEWNSFIFKNTSDTFHQSWEWGDMHQKLGYRVWNIGVFEGKKLNAVCLIIKIKARRGTFLHIPHGPIVRMEIGDLRFENILSSLTDYLISLGKEEGCSFVRIASTLPRNIENDRIFKKAGFCNAPIFIQSELSQILDIQPTQEDLLKNMRKSTRYILKKAHEYKLRYMKSTDPNDFNMFYNLYKQTVQKQEYVGHSYNFIKQEFLSFLENDSVNLYFVFDNKTLLSAAMIIHQNKTGFYHYGASQKNKSNIPSSHLLQWYIIQDLKRLGFDRYNFWGIAPEDKPNHPWKGLTVFKKGFGGEERAYLQTQDYILEWKYWINWFVETVRRIRRGY